jgi:hypothetical protein
MRDSVSASGSAPSMGILAHFKVGSVLGLGLGFGFGLAEAPAAIVGLALAGIFFELDEELAWADSCGL